jgi:hypothetical protein
VESGKWKELRSKGCGRTDRTVCCAEISWPTPRDSAVECICGLETGRETAVEDVVECHACHA